MVTNELRSYEISLWTLQDDFITVLKWSNVEQEGRIRDPEMKINIDGTQTLNFSIPMYLYKEIQDNESNHIIKLEKEENPIWYNTKNGNLITGLRKLKVIFNKWTEQERVFEFLITKVSESHEKDQLICKVESEGLAFHELGKIGYKISLSQDTYTLDKKEYDECTETPKYWVKKDGTHCTEEPLQTVQYWCEQCDLEPIISESQLLNPTVWYYDIQMNWDSFENKVQRDPHKVYEDEYVSSWNNELVPQTVENAREKARPIEIKESNIYNITQNIAETFKIYCRYEYGYDENYHIISRKIIFYNNYLDENNMLSFTYPYSASQITRDMDATELVTKMYVQPQNSSTVVSGQITIADCSTNKTKEDYLLNFDYLYTIGAITQEQYDAISVFEKAIRAINIELEDLSLQINAQEEIKIKQEALKSIYQIEVNEALEQINYNSQLYDKLGAKEGYITRGESHPYSTYIRTDANGRTYIVLGDENPGVPLNINDARNIHIYKIFDSTNLTLADTWVTWTASTSYEIGAKVIVVNEQDNSKVAYTCIEANSEDSTFQPSKWTKQSSWKEWKPQTNYTTNDQIFVFEQGQNQDYYKAYVCKEAHKSGNNFNDDKNSKWIPNLIDDLIDWNNIVYDSTTQESLYVKELILNTALPSDVVKIVYLTYQYNPKLYCDKVNEIYINKQNTAQGQLDTATIAYNTAVNTLKTLNETYDSKLIEKNKLIQNFNHMMGPALREGYWQPENEYQDYGNHKESTGKSLPSIMDTQLINEDAQDDIIINWDSELFDGEDKNYFEEGVLKNKVYYPCINLSDYLSEISTWLQNNQTITFIFKNNYYKELTLQEENYVENYTQFTIGGGAQLGFVVDINENVIPVLILTGAKNMTDEQIQFMLDPSKGKPKLGIVTLSNDRQISIVEGAITFSNNDYIYGGPTSTVYPRIKFSDNNLSTNSIVIKYGDVLLENYNDYLLTSRTTIRDNASYFEYFITIKPKVLFTYGYGSNITFTIDYTLSNAATCIYLDAQGVMLDSSKPKVSYTIKISALNKDYLHTAYNSLGQIIMINDIDLKFENVFGYISELNLKLDKPQEDEFEVKNYKTKFEDLFSTIVAQSEAMRKNSSSFMAAASGEVPLSSETLTNTINKNYSIMQAYLDSGFDSSQVVKDKLAEIFTEAAEILSCANQSVDAVKNLNIKNASILAGFIQNISQDLTPTIVTSEIQPENFKVGDIWNQIDDNGNIVGRYIATTGSSSSAGGYTRTFDGTLAAIKGASLNVDAVSGTVEILAQNKIDMKSGGNIYIAANENVDIVGNKAVNIGGTTINIAAATPNGESGGINIVSSSYNESIENATSKVLIHPKEIEMSGANIIMNGSNKIQMITSRNTLSSTSVLSISPAEGVWIGSGAGIRLYAGNIAVTQNQDGSFSPASGSGASIELLPTHLLFGVSENQNGSAAKFTKDYIILGVGGVTDGNITGVSGTLIGSKFTKNSIGFATSNNGIINAILMNNNGISLASGITGLPNNKTLANATKEDLRGSNGSYVRIASDGIDLGSTADLYINTNNFKLQTNTEIDENDNVIKESIFAIGTDLQNIDENTTVVNGTFRNEKNQIIENVNHVEPSVNFLVNKYGAYIKGAVYANAFQAQTTNGYFRATGNNFGFYDNNNNAILTINNNAEIVANKKLSIAANDLYIGNQNYSTIAANIAANNIIESLKMYRLWNNNNNSTNIIANSGTTTEDTNWKQKVPTPNNDTPYIWSVMRYKKGDNKYYYSTPQYEETLSNLKETTYYKFKRTNSTTAPTIADLNDLNTNWFLEVPTATASGNASTAASLDMPYIWRTTVTVKVGDRIIWATPERAEDYEGFSNAGLTAINIANGYTSVPHVETTGITINNGSMSISAQASLTILGNHSITIGSNISNSAVIIDNNGISVGTGKSIGLAAGGTLNISTTNLILKSDATGENSIFELKKLKTGSTTQYDTAMKYSINNGLEITGAITATSFQLMVNGTATNLLDNNGQISSSLINTSGFSTNGLGYTSDWNHTGASFVTLTSSAGLLIGSNEGIVVPSSDNAAGLTNPYLRISEAGIVLNGKHILINGQQEWSRDDIIVLKRVRENMSNNDKIFTKQEYVEYYMRNKQDWVLVKPYYNASTSYSSNSILPANNSEVVEFYTQIEDPTKYLGVINNYTYTIVWTGYYNKEYIAGTDDHAQDATINSFSVILNNGSTQISKTFISSGTIINDVNLQSESPSGSPRGLPSVTQNTNKVFKYTFTSDTNLCSEGNNFISVKITLGWSGGTNAYNSHNIKNVKVLCNIEDTFSRVPCAMFYYPNTQPELSKPTGYPE